MSNFLPDDAIVSTDQSCFYDSRIGFASDFAINGQVDYWEYFDGIHTYGVWNGYLFGTYYGSTGVIGRIVDFRSVDANDYYMIRLVMKYNPAERFGTNPIPSTGMVAWKTDQSPEWDYDTNVTISGAMGNMPLQSKQKFFTIYPDNKWHTYTLNMGPERFWQGDINNLRIWPAYEYGSDGDEFFIRAIEIYSVDKSTCDNFLCNKYHEYETPCPWTGARGWSASKIHEENNFTFEDSEFIININDYGDEIVKVSAHYNATGQEVANEIAKKTSKVSIGGYDEIEAVFENNKFIIYSGTRHATSKVEVIDNDLSRNLGFFDHLGNDISTKGYGETPATGYKPYSSFKLSTNQIFSLVDDNDNSGFIFEPTGYAVEGGRKDWQDSGMGIPTTSVGKKGDDYSNVSTRSYSVLPNAYKTTIDYNHPFNASGRITNIKAMVSLDAPDPDYPNYLGVESPYQGLEPYVEDYDSVRAENELSGAKLMIFRPKRDGQLEVVYEFDIPDRQRVPPNEAWDNTLYSRTQEHVDIDVDVFVNKGDLLGVYHASVYLGKSVTGGEFDAQYYHVSGKPSGVFSPGELKGEGSAGINIYARGTATQDRLAVTFDLRRRYNVENMVLKGEALSPNLEYNIARCLDINWEVDLFDHTHMTQHRTTYDGHTYYYVRENVAYGINRLNDGIYTAPDGKACDSFTITCNGPCGPGTFFDPAGPGLIPNNPYYFWVNGDEEWIGIYVHVSGNLYRSQTTYGFSDDPVSIYLHFPNYREKTISKVAAYFKENYNFRNIELSVYRGPGYFLGNSPSDEDYDLIPGYTKIIVDGVHYLPNQSNSLFIDNYLFQNPATALAERIMTSDLTFEWDPILSDAIVDFGGEGYFVHQTGTVGNATQWEAARRLDWTVLVHEFEPIKCKGFRYYSDYHISTKMLELELFAFTSDEGSSFSGGIFTSYSDYGEAIWSAEPEQVSDKEVNIYIGDTPRYIYLELSPIGETEYNTLEINIKDDHVFVGQKGCSYNQYLLESKRDSVNNSNLIELKNIYGIPLDLYVDIAGKGRVDKGLIYYNRLINEESVKNPVIGADGYYWKPDNYQFTHTDGNCAINCEVWGLVNLVAGAHAYYSKDVGVTWNYYGTLAHDTDVEYSNTPAGAKTIIKIIPGAKDRYWKIKAHCGSTSMSVREAQIFYQGEKLDATWYHDLNDKGVLGNVYTTPLSYRAYHISNGSVDGSYYNITGDYTIGFDLGERKNIDTIVLYHDFLKEWFDYTELEDWQSWDYTDLQQEICKIDRGNRFYLSGSETNYNNDFLDYSYYQTPISVVGNVIGDPSKIKFFKNSVYFPSKYDDYLLAEWDSGFSQQDGYQSVDCFIMFEELPAISEEVYICYKPDTSGRFYLRIRNETGSYKLEARNDLGTIFSEDMGALSTETWYHIAYMKGGRQGAHDNDDIINPPAARPTSQELFLDGISLGVNYVGAGNPNYGMDYSRLAIGYGLKGWITNFRWNRSSNKDGTHAWSRGFNFPVPIAADSHRFRYTLYSSFDNSNFGEYIDFDIYNSSVVAYKNPETVFSSRYQDFFLLDLGRRHILDIVRSYGASDKFNFTDTEYVTYYNDYTSDPNDLAVSLVGVLDDEFVDYPDEDKYEDIQYIEWGFEENWIFTPPEGLDDPAQIKTKYYLIGDFDLYVEYKILDSELFYDSWQFGLEIFNTNSTDTTFDILRAYETARQHYFVSRQDGTDVVRYEGDINNLNNGKLRLKRVGDLIYSYFWNNDTWRQLAFATFNDLDVNIRIHATHLFDNPDISVKFKLYYNYSTPMYTGTTKEDARWVRISVPNGDGTERFLRKIGIYPDITHNILVDGDGYNCTWDALGTSITNFETGTNLALGATVTGSTFIQDMHWENTVDGVLGDTIRYTWASENESQPWIEIDLGEVKNIYRVKIYHGYTNDSDGYIDTYIAEDYRIETSVSGTSYTTMFNISGNSSAERTHDTATPVEARFVRIVVTDYPEYEEYFLRDQQDLTYYRFKAICIREIEVREYYGFSYISSEEYPIIAIDLNQQFYLGGHSLVGIDAESTETDWDNDDSNFAYTDDSLSDPHKIVFSSFGSTPSHENWVAIRRNTATNYNDGPDYLKHAIISANTQINFCDYPWWWASGVSVLSRSYVSDLQNCVYGLEINYPATEILDEVFTIEGSSYGVDDYIAFRDSFSFRFYVDDFDDLVLDECYFYVKGQDGTEEGNEIKHQWSFNTISGSINNKDWTELYLRFKDADEVYYTEPEDPSEPIDPRMTEYIEFKGVGLFIKSKGSPVKIILDGFIIKRNHFDDYSRFDRGLYLSNNDFFHAPISDVDFSSGTIEFWLRADYGRDSRDVYNRFKNRSIFNFCNVSNDVFGMMFSSAGLIIYHGNVTIGLGALLVEGLLTETYDSLYHFGVVFSNEGRNIDSDSSTIKLFMNNYPVALSQETWDIKDKKNFNFTLGGKPPLAFIEQSSSLAISSVDGVVSEFKIYNYCKTDFSDSINNEPTNDLEILTNPNELIEISQDNVTFYKVDDVNLPFHFKGVPADVTIPIYVRSAIPRYLTGREERTAGIVVSWDVGV